MNEQLLAQLEAAQTDVDPQFKALRNATGALKRAVKLAGEEKLDALAMNKLLAKLQEAAAQVDCVPVQTATDAFTAQTQQALDFRHWSNWLMDRLWLDQRQSRRNPGPMARR